MMNEGRRKKEEGCFFFLFFIITTHHVMCLLTPSGFVVYRSVGRAAHGTEQMMLPAATCCRVRILSGVPRVLSRLQSSLWRSHRHARSRDTATRPGGTRRTGVAAMTVAGISFFKWLSETDEEKVEEQTPEQQIIWTLKRAKLNILQGRLEKAEELLHFAAHLAQNENHENALIYTYDLMANLAMQRGHFEQAEKLFKATMTLYLEHGTKQDDDAMIEMSLKIASIYASQKKHKMAVSGYEWCVQTAGEKVAKQNAHTLGSSPGSLFSFLYNHLYSYHFSAAYTRDPNQSTESNNNTRQMRCFCGCLICSLYICLPLLSSDCCQVVAFYPLL